MTAKRSTPSTQSWVARHAGGLFITGFGLVFTVAGLLILFVAVPSTTARSREVDTLAVVTPASAATHAAGTRVLLEARIASDAPERYRDFVAFRRREFKGWKEEGGRRTEQWDTKEVVAPALVLGDDAVRIAIAAADYEMSAEPHTWRSSNTLERTLLGPTTQEVVGFRRGDAVTADGVLERNANVIGIRITTLAGGSAVTYRASLRESVQALRIVGAVFACVGTIMLAAGLYVLRRRAD